MAKLTLRHIEQGSTTMVFDLIVFDKWESGASAVEISLLVTHQINFDEWSQGFSRITGNTPG
jgi:hypothetical protein